VNDSIIHWFLYVGACASFPILHPYWKIECWYKRNFAWREACCTEKYLRREILWNPYCTGVFGYNKSRGRQSKICSVHAGCLRRPTNLADKNAGGVRKLSEFFIKRAILKTILWNHFPKNLTRFTTDRLTDSILWRFLTRTEHIFDCRQNTG